MPQRLRIRTTLTSAPSALSGLDVVSCSSLRLGVSALKHVLPGRLWWSSTARSWPETAIRGIHANESNTRSEERRVGAEKKQKAQAQWNVGRGSPPRV